MDHIAGEALSSFRVYAQLEADQLKTESHGVELLNAIGYTYTLKADQWNAAIDAEQGDLFKRAWGFTGRFSGIGADIGAVREKYHIISDTAGTLKTALELQSSFTKLKKMEKQRQELGTPITPEEETLKAQRSLY
jgi:X-domain of DnaJ-containing